METAATEKGHSRPRMRKYDSRYTVNRISGAAPAKNNGRPPGRGRPVISDDLRVAQYNPPELTVPKSALGPTITLSPVEVVTCRPDSRTSSISGRFEPIAKPPS